MEKHMVIDENSFAYEAIDELCKLYKSYQDIMESRIFDDDGLVDERGECGQIGEAIVKSIYHIAAQYHQNEIDDENDDESEVAND